LEENWSLREAVRTPTLWLLVCSEALAVTSIGGIAFHLVAYYTDGGVQPLLAAGALSVFAFSGAGANVFWGFLAERVFAKRLYISALLLSATGVTILLQPPSALTAYVFACLFGLSGRGQDTLVHVLTAHYFGRRSFGSISGLSRSISLAGLGVGPFIAASAYDLTGSYQGVFALFLGAFMLAACLVLLLQRPVRPRIAPPAP
jgi:MFS family permease